jgi:hypothetical protein
LNPDPYPAFQVNPERILGLDDQKLQKKIQKKYFLNIFFDKKLQFTYVQATREAFSPHKRTSGTSKNVI